MWKQVIKILYPLCDEILYSLDPSHYREKKNSLKQSAERKSAESEICDTSVGPC